jgi:hypothetical protein
MGDDVTLLTFHEAWGLAKERPDYHKPDWNRTSHTRANETHVMMEWLILVRADDSGSLITLGVEREREAHRRALRDQLRNQPLIPIEIERPEAVVLDMTWLDACPAGQRRELHARVGEVEHNYAVDRRAVDVRSLVELLANLPEKSRAHVHAILDLLEAEGVGSTERIGEDHPHG